MQTQLPNQLFLGHVGGLSRPCKDIYYIHTGVFMFVIRFLLHINVVTIMCKYLSAGPPSVEQVRAEHRLLQVCSDLSDQKYISAHHLSKFTNKT